ncbi:MAG: glycosyltransferase family 4 protein [Planctomycetota bacterium]|jgi:glycosyltransferase involved in cell wall biosynthesis
MTRQRHILFVELATGQGGSARCLESLVGMCAEQGWRSSIALGYPAPELERRAKAEDVLRLYARPTYRLGLGLRRVNHSVAQAGGRIGSVAAFLAAGITADLPLAASLARYARRRQVDLIHANNELLVNRTAILAARLAGLPVVSHQRGWAFPSKVTRLLGRWTDRVVAISDYVAGTLTDAGVPTERIRRIYDGVDCAPLADADRRRSRARRALGFTPDDEVIGLPAALVPWKGHAMFLRALARVAQRRPQVRALIVGASPAHVSDLTPALRRQMAELGIADRVRMTGYVEEMADMYAAMDVVVHASQQPEPFGLVVVEAMACGRAVVAANAGGPAEIIRHGHDGWLYPMGDGEALAESLMGLLEDSALRADLARRAPERARCFDLWANHQAILGVYDELLAGSAFPIPTLAGAGT